MDVNNGSEQAPRPSLSVYVEHSQDLQEANATYCAGGKHLSVRTVGQHHHGCHNHNEICVE